MHQSRFYVWYALITVIYVVLGLLVVHEMDQSTSEERPVKLGSDHLATERLTDYVPVTFQQCIGEFGQLTQAAHTMVYCRQPNFQFNVDGEIVRQPASILMHLRFDGYLGFPGGIIEPGEDVWVGAKRELQEELGMNPDILNQISRYPILSHVNHQTRVCVHFYTLEISCDKLVEVERTMLSARDFGSEVLGPVRVPLYTMADGIRGLPLFLHNRFIGNTKDQLLYVLEKLELLPSEEVGLVKQKLRR